MRGMGSLRLGQRTVDHRARRALDRGIVVKGHGQIPG
jgi:hypothetical protein